MGVLCGLSFWRSGEACYLSPSLFGLKTRRVTTMKYLRMLCLPAILSLAAAAFGQAGSKPAAPAASPAAASTPSSAPQAQPTPAPLTTIAAIADRQVSQYEKLMVEAAEAMPAEKFDFTPASLNIPNAAYKDVRTFAVLIKHTATAN